MILPAAGALLLCAFLATCAPHAALAAEAELPYVGRDAAGNLVIETAPGQTLLVNGVAVTTGSESGSIVADLQQRLAKVEALLTRSVDGTTLVEGGDGAYLSRNKEYTVTEGASAWSPESIRIYVGDRVTWKWSGLDALIEVKAVNDPTRVTDGINSGDPMLSASFTHRFTKPGTHYFRAAAKGYYMTVNVYGLGVDASTPVYSRSLPSVVGTCHWFSRQSSTAYRAESPNVRTGDAAGSGVCSCKTGRLEWPSTWSFLSSGSVTYYMYIANCMSY